MEENCSIKLFESDLESMLSQVIAKPVPVMKN